MVVLSDDVLELGLPLRYEPGNDGLPGRTALAEKTRKGVQLAGKLVDLFSLVGSTSLERFSLCIPVGSIVRVGLANQESEVLVLLADAFTMKRERLQWNWGDPRWEWSHIVGIPVSFGPLPNLIDIDVCPRLSISPDNISAFWTRAAGYSGTSHSRRIDNVQRLERSGTVWIEMGSSGQLVECAVGRSFYGYTFKGAGVHLTIGEAALGFAELWRPLDQAPEVGDEVLYWARSSPAERGRVDQVKAGSFKVIGKDLRSVQFFSSLGNVRVKDKTTIGKFFTRL